MLTLMQVNVTVHLANRDWDALNYDIALQFLLNVFYLL